MNRLHLASLALLLACSAQAQDVLEPVPQMGRYMPLYPGQYVNLAYLRDARDSSFDADGQRRESAVPTLENASDMPRTDAVATFTWHFPLFEDYAFPFISSRTWLARVTLRYGDMDTRGALATFINDDSDDADTDADDLRNNGAGVGDLLLEFGGFLIGSEDWRSGGPRPFAVLLTGGLNVNLGQYDRDAPTSSGTNTPSLRFHLGTHWAPTASTFIDAGAGLRLFYENQDAAFGALAPDLPGDALVWDLSISQRLGQRVFVSAFATGYDGDPNRYDNPRFAPNPPEPGTGGDNYPTPGLYYDNGVQRRSAGLGLEWFAGQNLKLGLHWDHPLSGASGQFDLPYTDRNPPGCTPGSVGCTTTDGETVRVDGYGHARVFASDRWMLSATYRFGEGDTFTCVGCEQ